MAPATGRQRLADAFGLATILLALLDLLRPSLLLLPTITAGGDTPCHYPTAAWFHEHLLPSLRLHGADESAIDPDDFLRRLDAFVATAPADWDPFAARD